MDRDYNQITPWPWKWEFIGTAGNYYLCGDNGEGPICYNSPNSADGKLMQAAPELLAALRPLVDFTVSRFAGGGGEFIPEVIAARAAIAKAEGGE